MKLAAPSSSSSPRVPANARRGAAQLMFYTAAQEEAALPEDEKEVAVFGGAVVTDEQLEAAATPALDSVRACAAAHLVLPSRRSVHACRAHENASSPAFRRGGNRRKRRADVACRAAALP
jgi:hypothetical protein